MNRERDANPNTAYEAAKAIIVVLKDQGHQALFAGGCVRDQLLGKTPKDYDVATSATPDDVCKIFKRTKKVGAQFGVVLVSHRRQEIEVATFRSDGEYRDGRRPDTVTFTDAEHDAQRRDFTINGMFFDPVEDHLVDYVNGQADLNKRIIRCIGDPSKRFAEDHLRLLRAVRFAARLNFEISPETFAAIQENAEQVASVSPERIRAELVLMLNSTSRANAWAMLCESELCNHIIGNVVWTEDQQAAVGNILRNLPECTTVSLGFGAILSPLFMGKAILAKKASRALRCSNEETDSVCQLLEWCDRIESDQDLELADIKNMLASTHFDDICTLVQARGRVEIDSIRHRASGITTQCAAPPPLLDGAFLLDRNIPQGPIYRKVLDVVYRAQLNETIASVAEAEAIAIALIESDLK